MADRRALCVGINDYPGSDFDLSGCVNDAMDWAALLSGRGYEVGVLVDQGATKAAFLDALRTLVDETGYQDRLVVQYSGHGTWVPDANGDEADGRDEAIVLQDFEFVTDDELASVFARKRRGARITFVSDSCHSGSVNRLFEHDEPLLPKGVHPAREKFLPPGVLLDRRGVAAAHRVERAGSRGFLRTSDTLLLSGCLDTEYSYDAWFGKRPNGAFTRFAIDTLASTTSPPSYTEWFEDIRALLPSEQYPQTPDMSGTYTQRRRWRALD